MEETGKSQIERARAEDSEIKSDSARNDHILQAAQKLRRAIVAIAAADAIKVDAASSYCSFLGTMRTVREPIS